MSGRIRSIKPEVLEDEPAAALSDAAWRLWVSSWVLSDDHGRFRAGSKYLAANVWQDTAKTAKAEKARSELAEKGFVNLYQVEGQLYAELKPSAWRKHQRIDHAGKPRVPVPCDSDYLSRKSRTSSEEPPRETESVPRDSETLGDPRPSRARARPPTSDLRPTTTEQRGPTESTAAQISEPHPDPEVQKLVEAIAAQPELTTIAPIDIRSLAARAMPVGKRRPTAWLIQAVIDCAAVTPSGEVSHVTQKRLWSYLRAAREPRANPDMPKSEKGPSAYREFPKDEPFTPADPKRVDEITAPFRRKVAMP